MGTPLVSQDCAAELGHALQVSVVTARKLIADALTIRHRLPLLWQRVNDGEVWGWKAAKIAEATRHLGGLSSWALDRQTTPHLELMAWSRFLDVLDAALLRVDEATYQARAEAAAGPAGCPLLPRSVRAADPGRPGRGRRCGRLRSPGRAGRGLSGRRG